MGTHDAIDDGADVTRIDVTAEDIAAGKPRTCVSCPIALAVRRATGIPVMVGEYSITAETFGRLRTIGCLPDVAAKFVSRFDLGCDVEPFSFELEMINP